MLLHPKQSEVLHDPRRFKVIVAGRRWGKTALSKTTLIINAAKKKRQRVWYVAPTYRMAKQIMWDDLVNSIPKEWIVKVHNTELSIRLKNGSVIELRGADRPDTLRGVEINYLVLDEYQEMHPDVWSKVLRPTLAKSRGHALFIGTPKGYANLYDLYCLGQDPKASQWMAWQFPTITSPFIPESEIEQARQDMDEKSFRQEFEASFETMSGRVYYPFDRFKHVGDYKFNPQRPIWIGQDFNVDPMCTAIIQPQEDGTLWIVDELFLPDSSTEAVCEELERRYWRAIKRSTVYPDPAGGNRSSTRGESDLDIFRDKGFKRIKYRRKHPAVADRVNAVNRMLMSAAGEIRLFVDRGCTNTIESFEQTLYKPGSRDIDKSLGVEHMTDAIGYPIELEHPVRTRVIMGVSL